MKNLIISTLAVVMLCLSVNAETVAYWRLEEGPVGSTHSNNLDGYYVDSSGYGNNMSCWYFPAPVGAVPAAIIPQSELENEIALNFINRSLFHFTNNFMRISTQDKPIDSHDFTGGFTIECAMKTRVTTPGIVVNKDGDDSIPSNPFKLLFTFNYGTTGDNKISYEFLDSDYNVHTLTTPFTYVLDEWYWVACVCDGSEAWLYVKKEEDDDYELEANITDIIDGMMPFESAWTIGGGTVNGVVGNNLYGSADEVRICDYALEPDQFLAASGGDDVTPVAYWRFEEGTNGIHQNNNDDYYVDSSGNSNHMSTTDITPVLSVASTDVPFANVPQTGAADTMSRTFSKAMQNVGTFGAETGGNNIDSMDLDSFTVECMAKYNTLSGLSYIVTKDGEPFKNDPSQMNYECTFGIRLMNDGRISSYFCDENKNLVHSFTTFACNPSEWYRFAFVCVGGTQAFLYVKGESDTSYDIKATMNTTWTGGLPIVGGMINSSYPWAIGRGMHLGHLQDGFDGNIDEVRISDIALPPDLFLGSVPEPGIILGGIALALLAFRRK